MKEVRIALGRNDVEAPEAEVVGEEDDPRVRSQPIVTPLRSKHDPDDAPSCATHARGLVVEHEAQALGSDRAAPADAMPGVPDAVSPARKSPCRCAQPQLLPIHWRSGVLKRTAPRKQGQA